MSAAEPSFLAAAKNAFSSRFDNTEQSEHASQQSVCGTGQQVCGQVFM
jgi:hypothetical protein